MGARRHASCSACREGGDFEPAIRMAFQPIVDCETGAVWAYEALVRPAAGGKASTVLEQVTSANRYGFDQLCRIRAIEEACAAGLMETDAKLSINFLPDAVYSPLACIRLTLEAARRTQLPPDRLMFEFTETEELDVAHVQAIIACYQEIGFTCALDDFGAGYSGLGLLASFQPEVIKLDMHLVRGIAGDEVRRAIVMGLAATCRQLGITLVAEGIETRAECDALRLFGVRYMQGFLFARPALGELPLKDGVGGTELAWVA